MCFKLTMKTQNDVIDFVLFSLLLTWNIFHNFFSVSIAGAEHVCLLGITIFLKYFSNTTVSDLNI